MAAEYRRFEEGTMGSHGGGAEVAMWIQMWVEFSIDASPGFCTIRKIRSPVSRCRKDGVTFSAQTSSGLLLAQ